MIFFNLESRFLLVRLWVMMHNEHRNMCLGPFLTLKCASLSVETKWAVPLGGVMKLSALQRQADRIQPLRAQRCLITRKLNRKRSSRRCIYLFLGQEMKSGSSLKWSAKHLWRIPGLEIKAAVGKHPHHQPASCVSVSITGDRFCREKGKKKKADCAACQCNFFS